MITRVEAPVIFVELSLNTLEQVAPGEPEIHQEAIHEENDVTKFFKEIIMIHGGLAIVSFPWFPVEAINNLAQFDLHSQAQFTRLGQLVFMELSIQAINTRVSELTMILRDLCQNFPVGIIVAVIAYLFPMAAEFLSARLSGISRLIEEDGLHACVTKHLGTVFARFERAVAKYRAAAHTMRESIHFCVLGSAVLAVFFRTRTEIGTMGRFSGRAVVTTGNDMHVFVDKHAADMLIPARTTRGD